MLSLLEVIVKVDYGNLERRELCDLERADLFVVDLGFIVGKCDCSPHATRQQHWILPNEAFSHVDEALVDCPDGPPIFVLGLVKTNLQIRDDVMVASLP